MVVAALIEDAKLREAGIISGLDDQLTRFKQPGCVIFVDELPCNTVSKVHKQL